MRPIESSLRVSRWLAPLAGALLLLGAQAEPARADRTVVVRRGDTLSGISLANYGDITHVPAIMAFNHLADADRIAAGETLRLPGLAPTPPASSPVFQGSVFQEGVATWYGPGFEGQTTKCGQVYHQLDYTAASNDLPCGTLIDVINVANLRQVLVPVTDTGAFRHPDVVDLSRGAFSALSSPDIGVIPVRIVLRATPGPAPRPTAAPKH